MAEQESYAGSEQKGTERGDGLDGQVAPPEGGHLADTFEAGRRWFPKDMRDARRDQEQRSARVETELAQDPPSMRRKIVPTEGPLQDLDRTTNETKRLTDQGLTPRPTESHADAPKEDETPRSGA